MSCLYVLIVLPLLVQVQLTLDVKYTQCVERQVRQPTAVMVKPASVGRFTVCWLWRCVARRYTRLNKLQSFYCGRLAQQGTAPWTHWLTAS